MYAYTIWNAPDGVRVEAGIEYAFDPYRRPETRLGPDSYVWPYAARRAGDKIVFVDDDITYVFLIGFDRGRVPRGPLLWHYDGEYDQTKALFALGQESVVEWTAHGKRYRARIAGEGLALETEED